MQARCVAAFLAASAGFWNIQVRADDSPIVTVQTAHVQRATIAQPVRAYGIVAASASNVTTINLPYVARIMQMRVQPGQTVARGAPLVVVQADPAAALTANQARSAATLALGELARVQSLYDKGLATRSQLAAEKKALQDAQQALAAQEQMGVVTGSRTVVAPLDGVVLQVSAGQGDQVQAGAAIMQLAAANSDKYARANVMLGIEPADSAAIHAGDSSLSVTLAEAAVTSRVVLVGAAVDPQSQLVNVGANVPLGQTAFIPGTRVSADIATNASAHWLVPRSTVLKDDKGEYVFQIMPDRKAHRVTVVTKIEDGDRYGVDGMLDGAQPLVVSGNYELRDGMPVQIDGGAAR